MNKLYKRLISLVTLGIMSMFVLTGCTLTIAKPAIRHRGITITSVGNGVGVDGMELEERNQVSSEVVTDGDYFREDLEGHLLLNSTADNYPIVLEIIHVGEDSVRFKQGDVVSEIPYDKVTKVYSSVSNEDWYNYVYSVSFYTDDISE